MVIECRGLKGARSKLIAGVELPLLMTGLDIQGYIAIDTAEGIDLSITNPWTTGTEKPVVILRFPFNVTRLQINGVGVCSKILIIDDSVRNDRISSSSAPFGCAFKRRAPC